MIYEGKAAVKTGGVWPGTQTSADYGDFSVASTIWLDTFVAGRRRRTQWCLERSGLEGRR